MVRQSLKPDKAPIDGSGLDISLGNRCSRTALAWARKTYQARSGRLGVPLLRSDSLFANLMDFGPFQLAMTTDGIGTKAEVAERTGIFNTLGFDLVAMVADDLASTGVEPVNLTNVLDVSHLDHPTVDQLMRGLHDAALQAGISVVGGEIAELGSRVGGWGPGMHFNWSATVIGLVPPDHAAITGESITPGDHVVALRSDGFRSNGFSLARRILRAQLGDTWHDQPFSESSTWGQELLTPSRLYTPLLNTLIRRDQPIHGVVHVTGGGMADNLSRTLAATALGAVLDQLHPPHPAMLELQAMGGISEQQAYLLWNMGNGMLLVVPSSSSARLCQLARQLGYDALVAGRVVRHPRITIHSKGRQPGRLVYSPTSGW